MRLYSGTTVEFVEATTQNRIADELKNSYQNYYGHSPSQNEYNSWSNSLQFVKNLIDQNHLIDNAVVLEYELPYTNERIDCLLFGQSDSKEDSVVVIELKQWSKVSDCNIEGNVSTFVGGAERMVPHPSFQVRGYHFLLKDFIQIFEDIPPVDLSSCVYCHNYKATTSDILLSPHFKDIMDEFPIFTRDDFERLGKYLKSKLQRGKGLDLLNRFDNSPIRPSKKLLEHTRKMIQGETAFSLIDEQITAYNTILDRSKKSAKLKTKSVIIVRGGPGTGKSVIALNVLAELLSKGLTVFHATGSAAFTTTVRKIVGVRAAAHFKYFNSFSTQKENAIDVLICDEAHRIRKTSNSRYTKREHRSELPQIDELIRVSKVIIFFIDDYQIVRPEEMGSTALIKDTAKKYDSELFEFELKTQFRCSGSDGYLNWIDNTLGIKDTANRILTKDEKMEFKIFNSPHELYDAIREKNHEKKNSARLVAGFCWDWSDANPDGTLKEDVVIGDFKMTWEAKNDSKKLAPGIPKASLWAHDPNGVGQIGSIYTIQGFEFEYVGVIFGPDLVYDPKRRDWRGVPEESSDKSVKRAKADFITLVKNTYRVLMTRGMKGCYVYFMDKETENFFRSRIEHSADTFNVSVVKKSTAKDQIISDEEVAEKDKFTKYLPVYSLEAAASGFGKEDHVDNLGWIRVGEPIPLSKSMFVAKVIGKSMEPTIPDESYCIFRMEKGGSRNGIAVLAESRLVTDPTTSQKFTVKRYHSEKEFYDDGTWRHKKIVLSPDNKKTYKDIILTDVVPGDFRIVAEVVAVL